LPKHGVCIGEGSEAVLQRIREMPPGTLGFEAVGEVDDDDYEKLLTPELREVTGPDRFDVDRDAVAVVNDFAQFEELGDDWRGRTAPT
jgi:hypothetical protein